MDSRYRARRDSGLYSPPNSIFWPRPWTDTNTVTDLLRFSMWVTVCYEYCTLPIPTYCLLHVLLM